MNINVDKSLFLEKQQLDPAESYLINESSLAVCIDSEYKEHQIYTLQVYIPKYNKKILVLNKQLYDWFPNKKKILDGLKQEFESQKQTCDEVIFDFFDDTNNLLYKILQQFFNQINVESPKQVFLLFFFAINDLYPAFGFKNLVNPILRGQTKTRYLDRIYRLRNIKGFITVKDFGPTIGFRLYDLYGFNKGNLEATARAVGVTMPHKSKLDKFKHFIADALLHNDSNIRQTFLEYSMGDAVILAEIWKERVKSYNKILMDCFNFTSTYLIPPKTFPSTIGRFVAIAFENFIFHEAESQIEISKFKAALYKIGYLNPELKDYEKVLEKRNRTLKTLNPELIQSHFNTYNYTFTGLSLASISFLKQNSNLSFKKTLANVTGGRCINERYKENRAKNVLDVDMRSCYGSSLSSLDYPIGSPFIYALQVNEPTITLKNFLKKHRKELIPGLFKIVVNGKLPFSQDFVFSKPPKQSRFNQLEDLESGVSNDTTDHVLLKNEIVMGVLTSDILEVIEKVSNTKELAGWYNLTVVSAIYYPKSKRIDSLSEWVDKVLKSRKKSTEIKYWTSIPLSKFIDPLLKKRGILKQELKCEKDSQRINELECMQNGIKLLVNTLYGVLASKYFNVGNVVVADNVTAKARASIWLIEKVLGGFQTITDGMLYQPDNILALKDKAKRPGFNSMSDYYSFRLNRSVKRISLLNKDWNDFFKPHGEVRQYTNYFNLDEAVEMAVNNFWNSYNLQIKYGLEHKASHTSYNMGYFSKAHYLLNTVEDKVVMKARGFDLFDVEEENHTNLDPVPSPIFQILLNYANNNNVFPPSLSYKKKELITTNTFKIAYRKDSNTPIRPGDFIIKHAILKFGIAHLPTLNLKQHKKFDNFLVGKNKKSYHERYNCNTPNEMSLHIIKHFLEM